MCANSDTATLRRAFGDGRQAGIALRYFEDMMPRGPAGCTRDAARDLDAEELVVVDATIIPYALNLPELLEAHRESGALLTVVANSEGRGRAEPGMTPVGVFIMSPEALSAVPETGYQDIKQGLIPRLHAAGGRVAAHEVASCPPRVNDSGSYFATLAWLLEYQASQPETEAGYHRLNGACVHESAEIDPDCRLVGRVHVGPRAVVEKNATVVGPTMIDRDCVVREDAVISRSALWGGATVGEGAVVDRCILSFGAKARPRQHCCGQVIAGPRRASQPSMIDGSAVSFDSQPLAALKAC